MSKIFIEKGDITEQKVDAIINAANSELLHGGGMAGVIIAKGGQIIQDQSNKIAPIPLGEAAVTEAGKLPCKFVIHAASMKLGELTSEDDLINSIKNSLLRAKELGIKSLAIPAVGTGVGEFPFDRFAQIVLKEVNEFIQNNEQIEKVVFVFSSDVKFNKFQSIYQSNLK